MASCAATQPDLKRRGARRWRSMLAALISLALALSFLHDSDFDTGDGLVSAAVAGIGGGLAQSVEKDIGKETGKSAPDWGAPHGDHCLAHVTTVSPHDNAAPVEYVTRALRLAVVLAPETADRAAPFKPPRA